MGRQKTGKMRQPWRTVKLNPGIDLSEGWDETQFGLPRIEQGEISSVNIKHRSKWKCTHLAADLCQGPKFNAFYQKKRRRILCPKKSFFFCLEFVAAFQFDFRRFSFR